MNPPTLRRLGIDAEGGQISLQYPWSPEYSALHRRNRFNLLRGEGTADKASGKHKVAVQRNGHFAASFARTGTLCWLTLQMMSNHTQADQQHDRGAPVGNIAS